MKTAGGAISRWDFDFGTAVFAIFRLRFIRRAVHTRKDIGVIHRIDYPSSALMAQVKMPSADGFPGEPQFFFRRLRVGRRCCTGQRAG